MPEPEQDGTVDLTALMAVLRRVTGSEAVVILSHGPDAQLRLQADDGLMPRERSKLVRWLQEGGDGFFEHQFERSISAPITYHVARLGVLHALRRGSGSFDNQDLLPTFAAQVAYAQMLVQRGPAVGSLLDTWSALDQLALSAHSQGELGRALTNVVGPLFGSAKLGVMVADRQRNMLQMMPGAFDASEQSIASHRVSFSDPRSNSARVYSTGLSYISNASIGDHSIRQQYVAAFGLDRVLSVPLGQVGVLHVANADYEFELDDLARAQALAPRIASLVELANALFALRREGKVEESLSELAIAVASGEGIVDSLPPALQVLCQATGANLVAFVPQDGSPIIGRAGQVMHELERTVLAEAATSPGMRAYVVGPQEAGDPGWAAFHAPVQLGGVRVGTLAALRARGEPFARSERRSFVRIANITALNHASERYQQQRAELARLQERQRIADHLHDDVAQILFAAQLSLDSVLADGAVEDRIGDGIAHARGLLIRGDTAIRTVIHRLARPPATDLASRLASIVAAVQEEFSIAIHLGVDPDAAVAAQRLRRPVVDALAKVAREALVNAAKHAGPCRIAIRLDVVRERLVLTIADDGLGVPTSGSRRHHHGLVTVRHLIREQGGTLRLVHGSAGGTKVTVSVPLEQPGDLSAEVDAQESIAETDAAAVEAQPPIAETESAPAEAQQPIAQTESAPA